MSISPEHARAVLEAADRLYDQEALEAAMDRMAEEITHELADRDPLVITIMHGGLVPAGMLLPRLRFPLQTDYLHATRYDGKTRGGELRWVAKPTRSLRGRTVLLVDDIYDEGHTLAAIVRECVAAGAQRVYSAVLLDKQHDRKADYRPDFIGLPVADRYVFGMGMDYCEYLRNLPGIYAVRDEDA
ncbi:MAG: hypoxanthine-guanine phosphoribosyltransferase [Gammaproteobacteria bacterium]|jgi:hypoxanthine phosphoribosyltransferase|nr:hypoxanthine-guanine phosphoribosyltransferase [Gammaproteobacteria bacterium]